MRIPAKAVIKMKGKILMNMFKKNGGFTLVELVVVIAILAILAGVAIPAYSGYIEKANKSNDDAQIVVIEQAIGAACAMKGYTPSEASVTFTEGAVATITAGDKNEDLKSIYDEFYAGNSFTTMKYYTELKWVAGEIVPTPPAD